MQIHVVAPQNRPVSAPVAPTGSGGRAPAIARDILKTRSFVAQVPAPPESLWYRLKKAILNVLCNIDFPSDAINRLTASDAFQARPLLKPGDVLLRRTEGTSGNFFIPSWWKHAAVYTGKGHVIEATFHGVQQINLKEFFTHGDAVVILRPKHTSRSDRKEIARYAKAQIGKPYDFDVDFEDTSRVSCTELAVNSLRAGTGKQMVPETWYGAIVGDDFLNADNFQLVWANKDVQLK